MAAQKLPASAAAADANGLQLWRALHATCAQIPALCSKHRPSEEPFLCFQRRARGDLLLESRKIAATNSAPQSYKILGSAQRRHRGAILQHGSFLVARSPAAPELAGWQDLSGTALPIDGLTADLLRQFAGLFGADLQPEELPESVRSAAREIERNKYSSRSWTARR